MDKENHFEETVPASSETKDQVTGAIMRPQGIRQHNHSNRLISEEDMPLYIVKGIANTMQKLRDACQRNMRNNEMPSTTFQKNERNAFTLRHLRAMKHNCEYLGNIANEMPFIKKEITKVKHDFEEFYKKYLEDYENGYKKLKRMDRFQMDQRIIRVFGMINAQAAQSS